MWRMEQPQGLDLGPCSQTPPLPGPKQHPGWGPCTAVSRRPWVSAREEHMFVFSGWNRKKMSTAVSSGERSGGRKRGVALASFYAEVFKTGSGTSPPPSTWR